MDKSPPLVPFAIPLTMHAHVITCEYSHVPKSHVVTRVNSCNICQGSGEFAILLLTYTWFFTSLYLATFLIPYFTMLALCGIPMMMAEFGLGQYLSLAPPSTFATICRLGRGK